MGPDHGRERQGRLLWLQGRQAPPPFLPSSGLWSFSTPLSSRSRHSNCFCCIPRSAALPPGPLGAAGACGRPLSAASLAMPQQQYGIPAIRRAGGGSIINTASFVSLRGAATAQLAYTSSKGAVLAMSRELAVSVIAGPQRKKKQAMVQ